MAAARREMGPDAMLVNSRKAPPEVRHLGEYEVVFGVVGAAGGPSEASLKLPGEPGESFPVAPAPLGDRLSMEVADLKKELEVMRRAITRTAYSPSQWIGVSPDISDAFAALTAAEVSAELAREIVQSAGDSLNGRVAQRADGPVFQRALRQEISNRFTADATLGRGPPQPRIVAMVGPPGSGKTPHGQSAVNTVWPPAGLSCCSDTYRVAAADQLRSYAAILGVGFQLLETVSSLAQTIEENRGKELIFIDTPGLAYGDLADSESLAHFLATRGDIDTHLVLPASMKAADLSRIVDAFEILRPQHLLFTKLDETGTYGPIFGEAARSGKPLSFFTAGQRIPEDLEAASSERVLDLVLHGFGGRARSAA
jgi:flagellar biosynthesis protein FlhF